MKLTLYHFQSCPYCVKVRNAMSSMNIEDKIELKDIYENKNYMNELLEINQGIKQVPCLIIDDKPMLESDDIIHFLQQTFE